MKTKRGATLPPEVTEALRTNPDALRAFQAMPASHQHEYLDWIQEAKRPETRARRIERAMGMMAEWLADRGQRER